MQKLEPQSSPKKAAEDAEKIELRIFDILYDGRKKRRIPKS
jgi:hypothetical protein